MNLLDLKSPDDRILSRCLRRQAEQIPDDDYLIWGDDHYSFGRVNALANGAARAFRDLGVSRGDVVCFLMNATPQWVWLTAGLNKLGAMWVPTNTDYKGQWLRECFEDAGATVLVVDAELLPRVLELGELPFRTVVVRGDAEVNRPGLTVVPLAGLVEPCDEEPDDEGFFYGDTAAILWTSGTTGRSKGVMQSHNAWIRGAADGLRSTGVREGDVLYNCLPMYQSAAWVANIYRALVGGLPLGMDPRFSASDFWDRTRYYKASMVFTLGAMHMFLWKAPERADDADNPVRVAQMVPFPAELEDAFKQRFGIEQISQGYGQSEVMGLLTRVPGSSHKPNALGSINAGIDVRLLDDSDSPVVPGQVGEYCIRPTEPFSIFSGYWRNEEATVAAWRNLWYHTGDLGRQDEDGEYFFVDRKADFIRFGGRNISSFAVEAAVGAHPAVLQCAAHGIVSEELASEAELKVCVVLKPGGEVDAEALARFVNETAPHFFVPRYIEFLSELPSTPTGRVQKFKLRERGVTPTTWDARAEGFQVERA